MIIYIFHNLGLIQIFFPIHKVLITSNGVIQNDYYIPQSKLKINLIIIIHSIHLRKRL
jgi:hypothetical protein